MFVISDNTDTLAGMRMAGADGVIVHTKAETEAAIERVLSGGDTAILLINGALADLCRQRVDDIKRAESLPLVVEIPDRHGNGRNPDALTEYIRSSIGG